MGKKITGAEYPLKKIFSSEFDYYIPSYQRPYSWRKEETSVLFDDLYNFYQTEDSDENYFLGSIVLIKEEDKAKAQVIDGQQRLTTLTILFAVMADSLTGSNREALLNYLREQGNPIEDLPARPRLHLRECDTSFFEKYIQNLDLKGLQAIDSKNLLNEAQGHIQENCKVLQEKISKTFNNNEDKIFNFTRFLLNRCYLVAVSTPNQVSAFRIFSVMNNRGLDLKPVDIIKAETIGKIDENEREEYTKKWEDMEMQTTRDGFNDVFSHIRTIYAKAKAKKTLYEEFNYYVKVSPKELIDNLLDPYSRAYTILKKQNYESTTHAEEINEYLMWLNKIDNSDWMPVAIKFFADHENDSEYLLYFFKKLERLAAYLLITEKDINKRIERYSCILTEMENNSDHSKDKPLKEIELRENEKKELYVYINGNVYYMASRRRNYLILRLDSFVSDGAAKYDPSLLTIEHVLPQTIPNGSEWERVWKNEKDREDFLHKIGNLVPLTRRHNSAAQNYEFNEKKTIYFVNKNGTTSYALTSQVINEKEWTPAVVKERQKKLTDVLKNKWEL